MKLLGLIASALALDYDDLDKGKNKGSKRPAKVETFDCGGGKQIWCIIIYVKKSLGAGVAWAVTSENYKFR